MDIFCVTSILFFFFFYYMKLTVTSDLSLMANHHSDKMLYNIVKEGEVMTPRIFVWITQ